MATGSPEGYQIGPLGGARCTGGFGKIVLIERIMRD